jgi:hypothetical protein
MIDADEWFSDWEHVGRLFEEARQLAQWDQTLTLLWFPDGVVPSTKIPRDASRLEMEESDKDRQDDEELGLEELDGVLRWQKKSRRR